MTVQTALPLPPSATSFAPAEGVAPSLSTLPPVEAVPLDPGIQTVMDVPGPVIDLSIWTLISDADIVVKLVILTLVFCSVWSWAIVFTKFFRLRRINKHTDAFEDIFWAGGSLDDLYDRVGAHPKNPMEALFSAAMREWRRALSRGGKSAELKIGLKERIERIMHVTLNREMEDLERRVGFLASVGSVAPYIGLLGTVWGIMESLAQIGASNDTNIAVVAPGISEALFTTALGLVVAIPALLAYNKISQDIARYSSRLEAFTQEFYAIISRQLEEGGA